MKKIAALLLLAFSIPAVPGRAIAIQTRPGLKEGRAPVIGYLKNEELVDMCGCNFEHRSATRGYTFTGESGGKTAWMNIDGQDVKLTLRRSVWSKGTGIGSQYLSWYEADGIKVTLLQVITRLCIPYGPECETTNYDAVISVTKGGRKSTVRARGICGCV